MLCAMAHAAIIHNPGGGSACEEDIARARELLCQHFECDVHVVEADAPPGELAKRALAAGSKLLIAAGGDGTVSRSPPP